MDRRKTTVIRADACERCGQPADANHVGNVCVALGNAGTSGLPWSLRAVQLSGGFVHAIEERRAHTRRRPA
jgi:hypothetical protein